jgi:hypothetical protein
MLIRVSHSLPIVLSFIGRFDRDDDFRPETSRSWRKTASDAKIKVMASTQKKSTSGPARAAVPGATSKGKVGGGGSVAAQTVSSLKSPRRGHEADGDEYVTNLKGQIYLLTVENEAMKRSRGLPTSQSDQSSAESLSSLYGRGATRAAEREREAVAVAESMAAAAIPDELADLEAHMRSKYAQVESKYVQDLAEARRTSEALSVQCGAQSSLIAALKQEVAAGQEEAAQGRTLLAVTEASLGADLRRAQDEITRLGGVIEQLHAELAAGRVTLDGRDVTIANLRSRTADAQAAAAQAEAAKSQAMASFARMYMSTRIIMKNWRLERVKRKGAEANAEAVSCIQGGGEGGH